MNKTLGGILVGATMLSAPIVPVGEMKLVSQSFHKCGEAQTYLPKVPGKKLVPIQRGYSDPLFCNGGFAVAEMEDSSGKKIYDTMDAKRYASTTKKGGDQFNTSKQEMVSLAEYLTKPLLAEASIAYVNSARNLNASTGTSYNVSYTVGSGSDRALVFTFLEAPVRITGVAYNGDNATLVQAIPDGFGNGLQMWRLENPDSGTNNITVTLSGTSYVEMVVVEYSGVDQTNMEDMSMEGEVTGTPSSPLVLTGTVVTADSWLVSVARNATAAVMTASTGVGAVRQSGVTAQQSVGDSNTTVTSGSQSQSWTTAGTVKSFGIMMAIKPAGGAPASVSQPIIQPKAIWW